MLDALKKVKRPNPKNPIRSQSVLRSLNAARHCEREGKVQKALRIYLRCEDDPYAKTRIKALSPLKIKRVHTKKSLIEESPNDNARAKITHIMSGEEYQVFQMIDTFVKRKQPLRQNDINEALGFSQKKVADCIEKLQDKGYIHKTEREYRHITILKHPVVREGVVGMESSLPEWILHPPQPVIFSFKLRNSENVTPQPMQKGSFRFRLK